MNWKAVLRRMPSLARNPGPNTVVCTNEVLLDEHCIVAVCDSTDHLSVDVGATIPTAIVGA